MSLSPYQVFEKNLGRAETLVNIHKTLSGGGRGRPPEHTSDLLRSAVVTAVAAMDAYLHDIISQKVVPTIRARRKRKEGFPGKLVKLIKDELSHEKMIDAMCNKRPLAIIGTTVKKNLDERAFQNPGRIENGLRLLGIDDLWFKIGQELEVSKEDAKNYIITYTNRRNQIVHKGDLSNAKKTKNRLAPIKRQFARDAIESIGKFTEALNTIISKEFSPRRNK